MLKSFTIFVAALVTAVPALAEVPTATDRLTKAQARERLAACGTQWQAMKRSGSDGAQIWREFSQACMARATSKPATTPGAAPKKENASPIR